MTSTPRRLDSLSITPQAFITRFLHGAASSWPWAPEDEEAARAFLDEAAQQHFESLLAWHLKGNTLASDWPSMVTAVLDRRLLAYTAREAIVQRELAAVFSGLQQAGTPAILAKGSALAYTVYPAPTLRRRNDTDMLIRHDDLDRVASVLSGLGYRRGNYLTGQHVSHQALFSKTDANGVVHDLDVHWKMSNRPLFADILQWNELYPAAVPVPTLGTHARALGPVHALVMACMHPVAHHGGEGTARARWVYDVHLIAGALTPADMTRWVELVTARRISKIGLRGLELAHARFGTEVPAAVFDALRSTPDEPSAQYMSPGPWTGDVRLSDLRTTPGLRAKLQLIREVVVPTKAYMQEAYGVSTRALLGPLYVYRVVRGSWRLLLRLVSRRATNEGLS